MAVSFEQFSALVSGIYAAALEPERQPDTLRAIVEALGGAGGAVLAAGPGARHFRYTASDIDSDAIASYDARYGALDPMPPALEKAAVGAVFGNHQIIAPADMRRTEFYADWARTIGSGDGIVANLLREGGGIGWLICSAPMRGEPFATDERLELMRLLVPHLGRALRIEIELETAARRHSRTLEAFEHLRHGVVWLAPAGRVVHFNAAAAAILRGDDGLTLRAGRNLTALLPSEDTLLKRLLGLAGNGSGSGLRSGGSLSITRPAGRGKLAIHVLPLARDAEIAAPDDATILVMIVDTGRPLTPLPHLLRRLYGLTPTEAEIALAVLRSDSLQAAADARAVSLSTVRTHLQRVYDKIGLHRRADLARLLQALDGGIAPPGETD